MDNTKRTPTLVSPDFVGARVRALREGRRWSQTELARELGLSQPRLSQIERGQGSFSAEQLLRILELFNVGVEHFAPTRRASSAIQNALARHGARHLVTSPAVVPSRFDEVTEVVVEVLVSPESPRHLTALGPVLLRNVDRLSLAEVASRLAKLGRHARLGWLLDAVSTALDAVVFVTAADRRDARRLRTAIDLFLPSLPRPAEEAPLDLIDAEVRSAKTVARIEAESSEEAKRWRIATRLAPTDFVEALEANREVG